MDPGLRWRRHTDPGVLPRGRALSDRARSTVSTTRSSTARGWAIAAAEPACAISQNDPGLASRCLCGAWCWVPPGLPVALSHRPGLRPDSSAQVATPVESSQVFEPEAAVDPTPPAEAGTVPEGEVAEEGTPTDEVPETDLDDHTSDTEIQTPGYGNAAEQSSEAKRAEIRSVESACQSTRRPRARCPASPGPPAATTTARGAGC